MKGMKTLILTSTPTDRDTGEIIDTNDLSAALRAEIRPGFNFLFITSDPDNIGMSEGYAAETAAFFENLGLPAARVEILDSRTAAEAPRMVRESHVIFLAGGHVPTENAFFRSICLKELLREWDGVIVGCSAGTMNCAATVYACPEEPGEAVDPNYQRFIPGLGLTDRMIIPHWQTLAGETLDGLNIIEDIIRPDSRSREFLCIPDGTYLVIKDGTEEIRGEFLLMGTKA